MSSWVYYASTLITLGFIDLIAAFALDLSIGLAGILNFGFILFQAVGAYVTAVLSLGSPAKWTGVQRYAVGWNLPFPLPYVGAVVCGVICAAILGAVILRRVRADYQGIVLLAAMLICYGVVQNTPGLLNGTTGLAGIPQPFGSVWGTSGLTYEWFYAGLCAIIGIVVLAFMRVIYRSPFGRVVAATRENEAAALGLRYNVYRIQLVAFSVSGGIGALSGALLVGYIGAFSTQAWSLYETIVLFSVLIVGGLGNNWGTIVGTVIVQVVILQGSSFVPQFGPPGFVSEIAGFLVGVLFIGFLWFKPRGLLPERRELFEGGSGRRRRLPEAWKTAVVGAPAGAAQSRGAMGGALAQPSVSSPDAGVEPEMGAQRALCDSGGSAEEVREVEAVTGWAPAEVLIAKHVSYEFGGVRAVRDVSVSVVQGEMVAIMGPNGAGKTTLLNVLAGAFLPSEGTISLLGNDVTKWQAHKRAQAGLIRTFQESAEFKRLTCTENLLVGAWLGKKSTLRASLAGRWYWREAEDRALSRAGEILTELGLAEHRNDLADTLSGGERRLLEIGRALMANPTVILLDEPTAGVHPKFVSRVLEALQLLRSRGAAVVITVHEPKVAELCDRVIFMASGAVIKVGSFAAVSASDEVVDAYLGG